MQHEPSVPARRDRPGKTGLGVRSGLALIATSLLLFAACSGSAASPSARASAAPTSSPSATSAPSSAAPTMSASPTATAASGGHAPAGGRYGSGSSAAPSPSGSSAVIGSGSTAGLGTVLTGVGGKTLYTFSPDTATTSACTSQGCVGAWPPFVVPAGAQLVAASGVTGTLGTITRPDGSHQVTYNGHPLYYFAGDTAAGDTSGQAIDSFGGTWTVATP
jgi:predicted lipoprotein with Yx(FWY)xxD motif